MKTANNGNTATTTANTNHFSIFHFYFEMKCLQRVSMPPKNLLLFTDWKAKDENECEPWIDIDDIMCFWSDSKRWSAHTHTICFSIRSSLPHGLRARAQVTISAFTAHCTRSIIHRLGFRWCFHGATIGSFSSRWLKLQLKSIEKPFLSSPWNRENSFQSISAVPCIERKHWLKSLEND